MRYPSVTTVLSRYSDFSRVPPDVLQAASERGTRLHCICQALAEGLWVPDIDPGDTPYIQSFTLWFEAAVDKVIATEPELKCKRYGFVGHPDAIVKIKGDDGLLLVDLKSPVSMQKSWALQLSAYYHLAKEKWPAINRVGSLRLSPEGKPAKFDEFTKDLSRLFNIFVSALNCHNYFAKE